MQKLAPRKKTARLLILILSLLLSACTARQAPGEKSIPLASLNWVSEMGGVVPLRAPLSVRDQHYHWIGYDAKGERIVKVFDEVLFPTDVMIVYQAGMQSPNVFLARSPHGGCLLNWDSDAEKIIDPCYGSQFTPDGRYWLGPSPRDLDRLPSSVRESVIWVSAEIEYGKEHP